MDTSFDLLGLRPGEDPLGNGLFELKPDEAQCPVKAFLPSTHQTDVDPVLGKGLGQTRTHEPGADDNNFDFFRSAHLRLSL